MEPPSARETRLNDACGDLNCAEARRLLMSQAGTSAAEKLQKVLHYLVRDCGHVVKLLCTRGGYDKDTVYNSHSRRLVHKAAWIGASKALQALLECGANASLADNEGGRALHLAAQEGKLDCVSLLLRFDQPVNCKTADGNTPLHYAVALRCMERTHSCGAAAHSRRRKLERPKHEQGNTVDLCRGRGTRRRRCHTSQSRRWG
jgi:hypothetical protein